MNPTLESLIIAAFIGGALGFFVLRWWLARRRKGCSGGCCSIAPKQRGFEAHEQVAPGDVGGTSSTDEGGGSGCCD